MKYKLIDNTEEQLEDTLIKEITEYFLDDAVVQMERFADHCASQLKSQLSESGYAKYTKDLPDDASERDVYDAYCESIIRQNSSDYIRPIYEDVRGLNNNSKQGES